MCLGVANSNSSEWALSYSSAALISDSINATKLLTVKSSETHLIVSSSPLVVVPKDRYSPNAPWSADLYPWSSYLLKTDPKQSQKDPNSPFSPALRIPLIPPSAPLTPLSATIEHLNPPAKLPYFLTTNYKGHESSIYPSNSSNVPNL